MSSTTSCWERWRSLMDLQQLTVPELMVPPYSSQMAGQEGQPGS